MRPPITTVVPSPVLLLQGIDGSRAGWSVLSSPFHLWPLRPRHSFQHPRRMVRARLYQAGVPILVVRGNLGAAFKVPNDVRGDKDDQFLLQLGVKRAREELAQERDVTQEWDLGQVLGEIGRA